MLFLSCPSEEGQGAEIFPETQTMKTFQLFSGGRVHVNQKHNYSMEVEKSLALRLQSVRHTASTLYNLSSELSGSPSRLPKPYEATGPVSLLKGQVLKLKVVQSASGGRGPYLGYGGGALLSATQFRSSTSGGRGAWAQNGRKTVALILISLAEGKLQNADFWAVNQKLANTFYYWVVFPQAHIYLWLSSVKRIGIRGSARPLCTSGFWPDSQSTFL